MKNVNVANAKIIYEASKNQKLVIIVGSGVSKNSGIPIWNELLSSLKKDLPKSVEQEYDIFKVAQLHQNTFGFKDSTEKIKNILKCEHAIPNKIHEEIFKLSPCHIITTNYDNLLELFASSLIGNNYCTIRRDMDIPYVPYNNYIIKMHGDFVDNNIVLTENDYLNYSHNFPLISSLVQSLFVTKVVLCVGYSFNDPDLKMLLNTVKNVLKNNTPRIFMLSDFSDDTVNERYLQEKGVFPLWLDNVYLDLKESEETGLYGVGKAVYDQLRALQKDLTCPDNIIDDLYNVFSEITPQMPYLVWGMRDLIPKKYYKYYHLYSDGIQFDSKQIKSICTQIKSIRGLRKLIDGRVDKVEYLLALAWKNGIHKIDELDFSKMAFYKRLYEKIQYDSIDYICKFNFKKALDCIEKCKFQSIRNTSKDLELPFAYWCLGFYSKAFIKYQELSKIYAKTSNHILYFLCMHSQRMLANAVEFEQINDKLSEIDKELKEIRSVDFDKLIDSLNIPTNLSKVLRDISNFRMYLDILTETKELERKLLEDKHLSEEGGCSFNSNIPLILSNVHRVFCFSNINFVVSTNNKYAKEVFRSGITGLLLSHSIKRKEREDFIRQSRLEKIGVFIVMLMVFSIEERILRQVFKDNCIESMELTDESVNYIEECIDNIYTSSKANPWEQYCLRNCINLDVFADQLSCLMLICSKSTNQISNIDKLVDVLIDNNLISQMPDGARRNFRLLLNLGKINVSEVQANTIFEMCYDSHKYNRLLTDLSSYMQQKGYVLKNQKKIICDSVGEHWEYISIVYPISTRKDKANIEKWILKIGFDKYDNVNWTYFWWLANNHCQTILVSAAVSAYVAFRKQQNLNQLDYDTIITTKRIAQIAKNEQYGSLIHESMKEIKDPMFDFFMSPNDVEEEKVKQDWIPYLEDNQLREYLSIQSHKDRVQLLFNDGGKEVDYLKDKIVKICISDNKIEK